MRNEENFQTNGQNKSDDHTCVAKYSISCDGTFLSKVNHKIVVKSKHRLCTRCSDRLALLAGLAIPGNFQPALSEALKKRANAGDSERLLD